MSVEYCFTAVEDELPILKCSDCAYWEEYRSEYDVKTFGKDFGYCAKAWRQHGILSNNDDTNAVYTRGFNEGPLTLITRRTFYCGNAINKYLST